MAYVLIPGLRRRYLPIRRLTRPECDQLGYGQPLVLAVRQVSWIIGPWKSRDAYVVSQHPQGIVWRGNGADLARYGITVDAETEGGAG